MKKTVELLYVNHSNGNIFPFTVDTKLSYDEAKKRHNMQAVIPLILKECSLEIAMFGKEIDFPAIFAERCSDVELDQIMVMVALDVDVFINEYIYLKLPKHERHSLVKRNDPSSVWKINGAGLNGFFLAQLGKNNRMMASIAPYGVCSDEFIMYT